MLLYLIELDMDIDSNNPDIKKFKELALSKDFKLHYTTKEDIEIGNEILDYLINVIEERNKNK